MAIYVAVEKKNVVNNVHFYAVSRSVPRGEFYMAIDASHNRVLFFHNDDLKNPIKIIDFDCPEQDITIPEKIDTVTALRALSKAYRALNQGNFPDRLDYCA